MDNDKQTLLDIGFMNGDGRLHFYLVNHSIGEKELRANQVGAILV